MGPEGLTLETISQNLTCLFEIKEIVSNRSFCKQVTVKWLITDCILGLGCSGKMRLIYRH